MTEWRWLGGGGESINSVKSVSNFGNYHALQFIQLMAVHGLYSSYEFFVELHELPRIWIWAIISWIRHEYEFGCHEFMWIWISKTWIWIWISASWIWHEYKYPVYEYEYQVHEHKYQIYAYIWIWAVWTNLPFDDLHFSPPVFVFSPILPWFSIFLFVKISQKNWVYFEKMTLTVSFLGIVWCRYTVFIIFFGNFFTFSNGSIDICIDFHIKKWPWKNCNFEIDILKSWK